MLLCRKWYFAPVLQEGVQRHHTPLIKGEISRPDAMIFLAHFVSGSDFTGEILEKILPPQLLNRLQITSADFDTAQQRYAERVNRGRGTG